ncbi:hypothetical protein [Azospirillum isscasi]|uniref:Uncharacterized protein n=1 Tax=Azospirillum isscasi TaxID=3053926 RepID=A0ABU0WK82_9PROT|nr:hypothetical protein [Azospirillum isscasi]MDQ2104615.1 hypothetical protein [Azospirillum isscasi]
MVWPHSSTARSMEAISRGVTRRTSGSALSASRSDSRAAVDRMARRSWLILATAVPSAASRSRWRSAVRMVACMSASSRSATPISSVRALGWKGGVPSGSRRMATSSAVSRRMGRTSSRFSETKTSTAAISEIATDSARMRPEKSVMARIIGRSSITMSTWKAGFLGDGPITRITRSRRWASAMKASPISRGAMAVRRSKVASTAGGMERDSM